MLNAATFLVLTDLHLAGSFRRDDIKQALPGLSHPTREGIAGQLMSAIAERFAENECRLDAVIFAGDAQLQGSPGGHEIAFDLIMQNFGKLGIAEGQIVATPGNHDVLKGSAPGTIERYEAFANVWRKNGCVVPWLDGIDDKVPADTSKFRLLGPSGEWVIYPINTSNWSQVRADVPFDLASIWESIAPTFANGDEPRQTKLKAALDRLLEYDLAHVSDDQLNTLKKIVSDTPPAVHGRQTRLAVMHHHLRSPGLRVEVKPFEGISNLEQVRTFLMQSQINVLIHGHKHEHAFRYEYLETPWVSSPHRLAVLSAATFDDGREKDAARIVTLSGLPFAADVSVEKIELPRSGLRPVFGSIETLPLWQNQPINGGPLVLQGTSFEELYQRAAQTAAKNPGETLIVHLDVSHGDQLTLPSNYPRPVGLSDDDMQSWLRDIVGWWQLSRSRRDNNFPYPHGSRLRLFGGKFDQIERMINLLKVEPTSRALAVLVDPLRDFTRTGEKEAFPSFTLMQVRKRMLSREMAAIDVMGIYRAQEFSQWWPVNIAELRSLQLEIASELRAEPGRISTVTTDARFKPQAPGQVAVPVFDRWLDQSPEKLFMLGLALVGDIRDEAVQNQLLNEWMRSLTDIERAAKATNVDGPSVPSEGLRMLTTYLAMISLEGRQSQLFGLLHSLALANSSYERSKRQASDLRAWSDEVKRLVPEIIRISPTPSFGGEQC